MKILVINAGSSSIKLQLFEMPQRRRLASALVARIGEPTGRLTFTAGENTTEVERPIADHRAGLRLVADRLLDGLLAPGDLTAIGHRVVHGGERFSAPTVITPAVKQTVRELAPFAPLHNPPNLQGIEIAESIWPDAKQVAVFDTAFHQTMPPVAYRYAIPESLYREHGIRVYGFHGTSHQYVTRQAVAYLGRPSADVNLITAHLGNGASLTAVRGGKSVDTSMGFSPLDGLVMGTRSGDIDPAVVFFLNQRLGMTVPEIDRLLNKESGLLGLTGANDVRDLEARAAGGDEDAQLALDMAAYRIRKYVGAYSAILGRVDALVLTAGIGENSAAVRQRLCAGLEQLGIVLDPARNAAGVIGPVTPIHADGSRVQVLIVPTNEELEIAEQTLTLL